MIAIQLTFPAGRYHATPWHRQVNEGAVEWPPSPWRLLRALTAVWHLKCHHIDCQAVSTLLENLLAPPEFYLPPATPAHTRHYMPTAGDKRTKVFDAYLRLSPDIPVIVQWPDVQLDGDQTELLDALLGRLSYFGRAESWVSASAVHSIQTDTNTRPVRAGHSADGEVVESLITTTPAQFNRWRGEMLQRMSDRKLSDKRRKAAEKGKAVDKVKLSAKEISAVQERLPLDWFDALQADTGDIRAAGWNQPPGANSIQYLRPRNIFETRSSPKTQRRPPRPLPTVARFAVASRVPPRLTDALWLGERVRAVLMGCSKRIQPDEQPSPVFSGKRPDGTSREDAHIHAHILCEATAGSRRVDFVTVYAPEGFQQRDEDALRRFGAARIGWHGGQKVQFVLLGLGQPKDFGGTNEAAGQSLALAQSRVWVSRTPLIPTQHLRLRKKDLRDPVARAAATERELIRNVRLELSRRERFASEAESVEVQPIMGRDQCGTTIGGTFTHWTKFRRVRKRGNGTQAGAFGYGFRLQFPNEVSGPIALGYGSHFGLGMFAAEGDR